MKQCSKCKCIKNKSDFYKRSKGSSDGLMSSCKDCKNSTTKRWIKKQPKDWWKKYQSDYKDQERRGLISRSKEKRALYKIKGRYGLSKDQIDYMLKKQNNCCFICKDPFNGKFNIDHDHDADFVRGLLCRMCNHGLGNFKDSVTLFGRAADYLEKSFVFPMSDNNARQAKKLKGIK